MKTLFTPPTFFAIAMTTALAGISLPAQAALVQDAALEEACQGNIPVVVHSGMGASIDFTQTGKVVQRAWLGDPSKVTLDADRPIEEGSSVLFLRRIEGLNFDGLPSAASTVLTTVLISSSGSEVCQFPISYSTDTPTYTSLRLLPNNRTSRAGRDTATASQPSYVSLDNVEAGINQNALLLGEENQAVIKIRQFIAQVRDGAAQQATAQELGIAWPLIIELDRQGSTERNYTDTIFL